MYSRKSVIVKLVSGYDSLVASSVAIGDILITATKDAAYKADTFSTQLRSLQTHVLAKMFSSGVKVVTRSSVGRIHCHAAVSLSFDTAGFDWDSFDQAERWYNLYKHTKDRAFLPFYKYYTKIYRASMPPKLKAVNEELRKKARAYGFGHIFCLPVRKNTDALKWYLVKNIPYKRTKRDKGVHYFTSWGLEKTGKFKPLSFAYTDYRERLKLFAESLHLTADNYNIVLKEILGGNWHWRCRDYIKHIAMLPDGLFMPPQYEEGYKELAKTIKQHLVRSGQYVTCKARPSM